jgi:hypothetical protein
MLTHWYNFSYTINMKTAISIPDKVFNSAEKLASRLGKTRSQLYSQAISSYVARHQTDDVTKRLDEIYASQSSKLDAELGTMQSLTVPKEQW